MQMCKQNKNLKPTFILHLRIQLLYKIKYFCIKVYDYNKNYIQHLIGNDISEHDFYIFLKYITYICPLKF